MVRLSSIWSSITGSKIKEITPQNQCPWFDGNRPHTSIGPSAERTSSPARASMSAGDARPSSSRGASSRRMSRGLSFSKRKSDLDWKQENGASLAKTDIPQVPSMPPIFAQGRSEATDEAPPGTAVSTDESVSTDIFELPADVVISTTEKPPRIRSEGALPARRRKSSASEICRDRRKSWFANGTKHKLATSEPLPPPLPPPQAPLPPPPTSPPEKTSPGSKRRLSPQSPHQRDSKMRMSKPSLEEDLSTPPEVPLSAVSRSCIGSISMLEAFPSVPSPPATTMYPQDSVMDLVPDKPPSEAPPLSPSKIEEQAASSIVHQQHTDAIDTDRPRSPSHKHKHSRESKPLPAIPKEAKRDEIQLCGSQDEIVIDADALGGDDVQESNKLSLPMDSAEDRRSYDIMEALRGFEADPESLHPVHKFSNAQALAALEFGV